jgi:MOSC domain-containing protein YiiM
MGGGKVISVAFNASHSFSKTPCSSIELVAGKGVVGDAHNGVTVKHRSRVAADPNQPNLRQVHLIHSELFDELAEKGFDIHPADLGDNITTRGIDLLSLPLSSLLHINNTIISITGLRNPCIQLNNFSAGLMSAVLDKADDGSLIRKAGVMGIVTQGGTICAGDAIEVESPCQPFIKLDRV